MLVIRPPWPVDCCARAAVLAINTPAVASAKAFIVSGSCCLNTAVSTRRGRSSATRGKKSPSDSSLFRSSNQQKKGPGHLTWDPASHPLDGQDDAFWCYGIPIRGACAAAWELYVKLLVWWLWFNREFAEWKIDDLHRRRTRNFSVHSKRARQIGAAGEDPAAEQLKREALGRLLLAREKSSQQT
jgi:hypothetical protein